MKENNICKKCGYEWESKISYPKSCPRCKSYKWKVENEKLAEEDKVYPYDYKEKVEE